MDEFQSRCQQCQMMIPMGAMRCPYCRGDPSSTVNPFGPPASTSDDEPLGCVAGTIVAIVLAAAVLLGIKLRTQG